jgi:acyl-coenzyme A thioesterase PaaI-like protein
MATAEMTEMPWIAWLDLDTEFDDDGSVRVILRRPKAEHLNHNQHVNAPIIYAVAEVAGAGAVVIAASSAGSDAYTVIKSAAIDYQRPAHRGVTAVSKIQEGAAQHLRRELDAGRGCDTPVSVAIFDEEGTATGTCQFIVSQRPRRDRSEHALLENETR